MPLLSEERNIYFTIIMADREGVAPNKNGPNTSLLLQQNMKKHRVPHFTFFLQFYKSPLLEGGGCLPWLCSLFERRANNKGDRLSIYVENNLDNLVYNVKKDLYFIYRLLINCSYRPPKGNPKYYIFTSTNQGKKKLFF